MPPAPVLFFLTVPFPRLGTTKAVRLSRTAFLSPLPVYIVSQAKRTKRTSFNFLREISFCFSIFCQKSVQCFSDAVFRISAAEPKCDLPPSKKLKEAIIHNKPYLRFGNRSNITFEPVPLGDELFSFGIYLVPQSDYFKHILFDAVLRNVIMRHSVKIHSARVKLTFELCYASLVKSYQFVGIIIAVQFFMCHFRLPFADSFCKIRF